MSSANLGCSVAVMYNLDFMPETSSKWLQTFNAQRRNNGLLAGNLIVFSHREGNRYATDMIDYIRKNKLGTVMPSEPTPNPNYIGGSDEHNCLVWVWSLDMKVLADMIKELEPKVIA